MSESFQKPTSSTPTISPTEFTNFSFSGTAIQGESDAFCLPFQGDDMFNFDPLLPQNPLLASPYQATTILPLRQSADVTQVATETVNGAERLIEGVFFLFFKK